VLGYLTPKLIDKYSRGYADRAGRCYGINIVGGILGPLFAGYLLLPFVDVRIALLVLALPIVALALVAMRDARQWQFAVPLAALIVYASLFSRSYEEGAYTDGPREEHRDYVATAIAYGEGMNKGLLVNGVGITLLSPTTKIMAHLPLALSGHARNGLVICFGIGTTFRSMYSWGIETTAVDLTQSVVKAFGFFHSDAAKIVADPRARLVIDDGRRLLTRESTKYDVIVIDPPPPVEAAGSSLLYSKEFYDTVKLRLQPDGILAQWLPENKGSTLAAAARSLVESFPYVIAFRSTHLVGVHMIASMAPITLPSPAEFVARMPKSAQRDLLEWSGDESAEAVANDILSHRVPLSDLTPARFGDVEITDNHPFNEYYMLRRHLWGED
jgi:spermidine synthase